MTDGDDDQSYHPSEDDALEPPDDIYNPEVDQERLEQDHDRPASPAKPHLTTPPLPPNHPGTDTEIDAQDLYDEGLTSATNYDAQEEVEEPEQYRPIELQEEEPEDEEGT